MGPTEVDFQRLQLYMIGLLVLLIIFLVGLRRWGVPVRDETYPPPPPTPGQMRRRALVGWALHRALVVLVPAALAYNYTRELTAFHEGRGGVREGAQGDAFQPPRVAPVGPERGAFQPADLPVGGGTREPTFVESIPLVGSLPALWQGVCVTVMGLLWLVAVIRLFTASSEHKHAGPVAAEGPPKAAGH